MRGDCGVDGEGRVFDVPKFHSWGKCTTPLSNTNSDCMSNASSGLCIIYQRVGRLSMQGWRRRAIYAILKQKPYNITTNKLKAYLSAQTSSLSTFVISKTLQVTKSHAEDS